MEIERINEILTDLDASEIRVKGYAQELMSDVLGDDHRVGWALKRRGRAVACMEAAEEAIGSAAICLRTASAHDLQHMR